MMEEIAQKVINSRKELMVDTFEFQFSDMLKASPDTRYSIGMYLNNWLLYTTLKEVGEEHGWDAAKKLWDRVVHNFFEHFLNMPEMKKAIETFNEMGFDDPTIVAATMCCTFDYMFGHVDKIDEEESSPGRTMIVNLDCKIWNIIKSLGMEGKFDCEGGCALGGNLGAKAVHPKMRYGRQTEKGYVADFSRTRGDSFCGGYMILEE